MALLEIRDLKKSYTGPDGGRATVLDLPELVLEAEEQVALRGVSGSGKTTLLHLIAGVLRPDSGSILLDGEAITDLPMYKRARYGIGYLPQESSVFRRLSVEDNILAILEMMPLSQQERSERTELLLKELDLTHLRSSKAYALSGGERRRLEITRALVTQPRYMLLDEPFAGVDPIAVDDLQSIVAALRDRGLGILITDHNVRETLQITDRAYLLYDGKILKSGDAGELIADPEARRLYLGEDFRL